MIGTQSRLTLPPLEYRYAFDAVMPRLAQEEELLIRCDVPQLMSEITQRFPFYRKTRHAKMALWVEPLQFTWQDDLMAINDQLRYRSLLIIIASRPLACLLPERQTWEGKPLGIQVSGLARLRRKLGQMGWVVERHDGIHSLQAIVLNQLSGIAGRFGRVAWADRLEFAARLHYRTTDLLTPFSTVALLVARKENL